MRELTKNKRWQRLSELCWEGFDKVMQYSAKHYPNDSNNKSLELFMNKYDGDWNDKIKKISK